MTNIYIFVVVILFSLKAFSNETIETSQSNELETSLEQKQIKMIKDSIHSVTHPKVQTETKKS